MSQAECQQKDIAKALGISQVSVSLALRNSPRVSKVTREKVAKMAAKMGYKRNPFSSALRARRGKGQHAAFKGTIAWLTNFPDRDGWKEDWILEYYHGAAAACESMGYELDPFWYRESGISPKRLGSMLRSRGIVGIIIPPQPHAHIRMGFDWDQFCAIRIGYSLEWPPLNLVTNHQFDSVIQILHHLQTKGYQRIGFAVPRTKSERVLMQAEGAFLSWQQTAPKGLRISPYIPQKWSDKTFLNWVRKHSPDAIILWEQAHIEILRTNGIAVPGDIGVAFIHVQNPACGHSGINQNNTLVGSSAAKQLVFMIEHGEFGIPEKPQYLLSSGYWVDGLTTVKNSSAST